MTTGKKTWLVGNSQLITSIISAYCSVEQHRQCGNDWSNGRITCGSFSIENGRLVQYLTCDMGVLGTPGFYNDQITYPDNLKNFISLIDDADQIFVMLRGNEFGIESLPDTMPRWDFSYGSRPATLGRQFVPQRDVMAHFSRVMSPLLAICLLYRYAFPQAKIYHVAAPPPIESEAHILNNSEIFGAVFETYGVRPFELRKKIYDAMYEPLADEMNEHGIKTIFSPAECLTPTGGLRSDCAHGCLHGNKKYGEALMKVFLKELNCASV